MANILVVDDKKYIRDGYKDALEDSGFGWNILTAGNKNEAQKIISETQVDVVLTDLLMPYEQDGIDVLSQAKQKDPLTMVIIFTAGVGKLDRNRAYEIGAFDCLEKATLGISTSQELIAKTRIALSFRETAYKQIENQKKIAFLKRYFDPGVFGAIAENPELLKLQKKTLTIVFWDIRNFSQLCDIMKAYPELIVGFLSDYFNMAAKTIFEHNGVLDKFIGDGVMGLFGVLNNASDEGKKDAISAVETAIEFRLRFEELKAPWLEKWKKEPEMIDIGLGCGIHTGDVLVGNVGTELRDQFTALGTQVNLASRIQSESGASQVLMSQSTAKLVESSIPVSKVKEISDVKGFPGRKFILYEVKESKPKGKHIRTAQRGRLPNRKENA